MTPAELRAMGFTGFDTIGALRGSDLSSVPNRPGVYVILRSDLGPVAFLSTSMGGRFKGKDPSVSAAELDRQWIDSAHVLYIGKADAGSSGSRGIRTRLREYLRFGACAPIGHWGGRYLWHIASADNLLACWLATADPAGLESALLASFVGRYGRLPFANLRN